MVNICKLIKKQDVFGPLVQLNFRGKSQYNTHRGGCIAILLYVLTLVQAATLLLQLFSQEDPKVANYEITDVSLVEKKLYLH